jgi:hypothetical protein
MPVWTVQTVSGEDQRVEAGMLVTESGALIALSPDALVIQAWAPGQWLTVRHVEGAEPHPASAFEENVLVGLPQV